MMKTRIMNVQHNKTNLLYSIILSTALTSILAISPAQAQGQRDVSFMAPQVQAASEDHNKHESHNFPEAPQSYDSKAQADGDEQSSNSGYNVQASSGLRKAEQNITPNTNDRAPLWPSVAVQNNTDTTNTGTAGGFNSAQNTNSSLNTAQQNQKIEQLQKQVEMLQRRVDSLEFERVKTRVNQENKAQITQQPIFSPDDEKDAEGGQLIAPSSKQIDSNTQNETETELKPEKQTSSNDTITPLEQMSADALYQSGLNMMKHSEYEQAVKMWQSFIERFKNDARAAKAGIMLGDSYYAQALYGKAAETYLSVQSDYPKSAMAPLGLLKLAKSMANLNDKDTACAILNRLAKNYADSNNPVIEEGKQAQSRLQCL